MCASVRVGRQKKQPTNIRKQARRACVRDRLDGHRARACSSTDEEGAETIDLMHAGRGEAIRAIVLLFVLVHVVEDGNCAGHQSI